MRRMGREAKTTAAATAANGAKGQWGVRHPVAAALLFLVAWVAVMSVLSALCTPVILQLADNPPAMRFAFEAEALVTILVPAAVFAAFVGGLPQRPRRTARRVLADFAGGCAGGAVWFALAALPLAACGVLAIGEPAVVGALAVWVIACAVNAAFQEVLIHGYGFSVLVRGKGVLVAVIATTVVFTLLHPNAFMCGPIAVATIAAAGVLHGLVRLATGGLSASIALHAVWNALGGIGFGIVALADDYPHVFSGTLSGPAFLSGGTMGLEGSIVALAVTVAACVLVGLWLRRQHRVRAVADARQADGAPVAQRQQLRASRPAAPRQRAASVASVRR